VLKKFFSAVFLLLVLNAIIKPVWLFAIDRQVQNQVGTEAFGEYFALFNLAYILNFFLDLGLTTYQNRQLAADKTRSFQSLVSISTLKLLLGIFYGMLLVAIALITGITDMTLLLLIGFAQFLTSMLLFLRATITALQMFETDAVLSVLDKLIVILAAGTLIYFPSVAGTVDIGKFVSIQILALIVSLLVAVVVLVRKEKLFFRTNFDRRVLAASLPYALVILFMSAHSRLDGYLLERIHEKGAREAGIYASGFRILDAFNIGGYLIASFLLPFLAKNMKERMLVKRTLKLFGSMLLCCALVLLVIVWFNGIEIHRLLYEDHSIYAANVLALTVSALPGYYLVHVYGTYLTAAGGIHQFAKVCFVFMLINVAINLFFLSKYGAVGAAATALLTQTLFGIIIYYVAKRRLSAVAMQ
jgi:O-antigen/teichoic acid export membrane protein